MDRYVMTDGYVVADLDGWFLVKRVEDRAILYVHAIADADGVHVATQDGAKQNAATLANLHIADDRCVIC